MVSVVTSDVLADLRGRLILVQNRLKPLQETEASLKAQIRELLATHGPGEYQAGDGVIIAQNNRRLDLTSLAAAHPPTELPEIYDLTVSARKARQILPPEEIEDHMVVVGDLKIGVQ